MKNVSIRIDKDLYVTTQKASEAEFRTAPQ